MNKSGSVDEILEAAGFGYIDKEASDTVIETVLRDLAETINGSDKLTCAMVREAAIKRLADVGKRDPARMVDAALGTDDDSRDISQYDPSAINSAINKEAPSRERKSQATQLIEIATAGDVELFHDQFGDAYARLKIGGHFEIWSCRRGRRFRTYLAGQFWQKTKKAVSSEAINAALNALEAEAVFEGNEYPLQNRVAFYDGAIYYDLADKRWRAVKITSDGWEIVDEPPVLFRRYAHQRPQVEPISGGNLGDFLRFVNLRDPQQTLLLIAYLVSCLIPGIPHPIPIVYGPQGSAKTTLQRMLRRLIDPSATETLSFPHNRAELVQQLSHHWMPFYDNITNMPGLISDALCRATTGEGFSKRELYTDDEDVIYQFRRCVGLNGINVAAHKPDLFDRSILFALEPILASQRKPEQKFWAEFEEIRPFLVGAVLDGLSRAMALRSSIQLGGLPRMADFALWGCAIAESLGYPQQEFLSAFDQNVKVRNDEVLADNSVATVVLAFMEDRDEWDGSPAELLRELEKLAESQRVVTKNRYWPKAPNVLSRRLNEVRPNLAAVGIQIETGGWKGSKRHILIQKSPGNTVVTVVTVESAETERLTDHDLQSEREVSLQIPLHSKRSDNGPYNDHHDNNDISETGTEDESCTTLESPETPADTDLYHSYHSKGQKKEWQLSKKYESDI